MKYPKYLDKQIRQDVHASLEVIAGQLPVTDKTKDAILAEMNKIYRALFAGGCDDYMLIIHEGKPILTYKMRNRNAPIGTIAVGEAFTLEGA